MSVLEKIEKLNAVIGRIVSYFILIIMAITLWEVVLRYGFNAPTLWVHETSQQLFAVMFLLGGAYTLSQGGHVRVDIVYRRLTERGKAVLEIATSVFFYLFVVLLLYQGGEMAYESVLMLERTQTPWEPYVFQVICMIPVAAVLLFLQGAVILIRNIRTIVHGGAK